CTGIFNVADDLPAPPQDVIAFAAQLLGKPIPDSIPFSDADLSPMARSFYNENKRVRNCKIKQMLEVKLNYPTYEEGLTDIVTNNRISSL
ncbi:MAG: NAD(P)-dependent oxidoreductase, partial [Hyphomicrobiaceae bacterium]|nr:NAD(P)-dependent oxidoreductase [Hyphomicrobiaceae bacterium]